MVQDRIGTAQWVFERQLAWIAAADAKVAALVTINIAMLGGLAAAFGSAQHKGAWAVVLCSLAVLTISVSIFCSALALLPRTTGPRSSLLFFGRVSELPMADYAEQLKKASPEQILEDWSNQIHRNAEIALGKHGWVRKGMWWAFCGTPAWVVAVYILVGV